MSLWSFLSICHLFGSRSSILGTLFRNINVCLLCFHEKLLLFLESSWTDKKGLKSVFARVLNKGWNCWILWTSCRTKALCRTVEKKFFWKFVKISNFCLRSNRQPWQSYQMCQRKILVLSVKNRHLKPNFEPQFIIGMTSNRGHYLWKVTPNLPMYRIYPADLCTKIFNGI